MTAYVGGLRARLIRESVYRTLYSSLDALGWFDDVPNRLPVTFEPTSVDIEERVEKNTASMTDWDTTETPEEMGSDLAEHRWTYYVDFFAENDAVGIHFATDVKDILSGRMTAIGRVRPTASVYDFTAATPTEIFTVGFERILVDRPENYRKPWTRFQRSIRFDVVDHYENDEDS